MAILNTFTNKFVTDPEEFGRTYAESVPMNPFLRTGIPKNIEPLNYLEDPALKRNINATVDFYFNPFERRQYREATIPQRISQFQQAAQTAENLNRAGLLNSSLARGQNALSRVLAQMQLNQATDQIREAVSQSRVEAQKNLKLDALNKLATILNLVTRQYNIPSNTLQNQ